MSWLEKADSQISSSYLLGAVRINHERFASAHAERIIPTSFASARAGALPPRAQCVYNLQVGQPRTPGRISRARSAYKTRKLGAAARRAQSPRAKCI